MEGTDKKFTDLLTAMKKEEWVRRTNECVKSSENLKQYIHYICEVMRQMNKLLTEYIKTVNFAAPLTEHVKNVNNFQLMIKKMNEIYMPLQERHWYNQNEWPDTDNRQTENTPVPEDKNQETPAIT